MSLQGAVPAIILPSPFAVVASLMDMIQRGYSGVGIGTHIVASLWRVGVAFALGASLGISLGLLRGRLPLIDALFLVPSELVRPVPPLGLIPLFILWFGIGELSKILLIFLSVFLIMMVNAQAGSKSCALDALRAAQSMGANRWQTFRFVVLPSALPQIMTGLRIAMGTALTILVAAELLGGDRGLGFVILDASSFFPHDLCVRRHHFDRLHRPSQRSRHRLARPQDRPLGRQTMSGSIPLPRTDRKGASCRAR